MMHARRSTSVATVLMTTFALAALAGCNNANFGTSTATKGANDKTTFVPTPDPNITNNSNDGNPSNPGGNDSADSGNDDDGNDGSNGDRDGDGIVTLDEQATCLRNRAGAYKFALVFDSSGSMKDNDPSNARREGGIIFLNQLVALAKQESELDLQVSMITFSGGASVVSGWRKVSASSESSLQSDIVQATGSNGIGTNYTAALNLVPGQFSGSTSAKFRNFVIFLSDGEPNSMGSGNGAGGRNGSRQVDPSINSNILAQVSSIVSNSKVSMVTIAAGSSIGASGISLLEDMALPKSGTKKGMFKRAATASDMRDLWKNLLKKATGCG